MCDFEKVGLKMKIKRQNKIVEIISSGDVETQEELIERLRREGFDVTQATVSRDIKELGIIKISEREANISMRFLIRRTVTAVISLKNTNQSCVRL